MPYEAFANQEYRNALQSRLEIPALLRAFPFARGLRLLEVGCGRGVGLTEFARRCRPSRLVGVDIAPDLIHLAKARLDHFGVSAELHVGDVRRLPFADGDCDVVIDFGTCYHIDQPGAALREVARVLKGGGVFIHELPLAQLLAHPIRIGGRRLPGGDCAELTGERRAGLWGSRRKATTVYRRGRAGPGDQDDHRDGSLARAAAEIRRAAADASRAFCSVRPRLARQGGSTAC